MTPSKGSPKPAFAWPKNCKAAITFSFDDTRPSAADNCVPLLTRLGVKGTYYASIWHMEKRIKTWRKAVRSGHEIGNHTMSHPCNGNFNWVRKHNNQLEDKTLEDIADEMSEADEIILDTLGVKPTTFAYPCGESFVGRGRALQSYIPLVAERFRIGRGGVGEVFPDPVHCDPAWIVGWPIDGLPLQDIQRTIDACVASGRWAVFVGHEVAESGRQTTNLSVLEAAIRYALDHPAGIWVDTVAKVGEHVIAHQEQRKAKKK